MKNLISIIIILLFIGCIKKTEHKTVLANKIEKSIFVDTIEVFKDSISFGQKQNNKIEVYKIGGEENVVAKVYLYEKSKNQWKIKDSLTLSLISQLCA